MVDPFTAVTFPVALEKLAAPGKVRPLRPPAGKLGGVRVVPDPVPPNLKPPGPAPTAPPAPSPPNPVVHEPAVVAVLIVIVRAAMVVFDFLSGDPMTVRQSPTATAPIDSVAVSENVVVGVQFTVVCDVVLCTSIDDPAMEATLPLAPLRGPVGMEAAPATDDSPRTRLAHTSAAPPVATFRRTPRRVRGVLAIVFAVSLIFFLSCLFHMGQSTWDYSLRNASIGARWAARLAG
jgi:hypothetical protein